MDDLDPPFADPAVKQVFDTFAPDTRVGVLALRRLIFQTASATRGVGQIQETLKWGQPAYLTPHTKSGTTLRLGTPKTGEFAIFAHCQTDVISGFQTLFPQDFRYDGTRAVLFRTLDDLDADKLVMLITRALTYHMKPKP